MKTTRERLVELAAKPPSGGLLAGRDQVRHLAHSSPHPELDLEVVSHLPKDHWTANVTGIEFEGQTYMLLERKLLTGSDGPRHHFLLKKPEHDILFKYFVNYQPEEVRDIYRFRQRARFATWVETFAFLWGLTLPATQRRLARIYNYDPDVWTRWSIISSAVLGVVLGYFTGELMLGGGAGLGDAAILCFAMFLLWEAAVRWSKYRAGELRASLLGIPLEPLAGWFLRWE